MKKKYVSMLLMVLVMCVTACSSGQKEEAAAVETTAEPKTTDIEILETEISQEEVMEDEKEYTAPEEPVEADSVTGIVEKYEDNVIVIKDEGDEITYYFSTQDAQVVEGNVPIAVGDEVQVTYQGLLGDEEHPGVAVKIVAASVYHTETAG